MGTEERKNKLNGMEWGAIDDYAQKGTSAEVLVKKRIPKRLREIPKYYFLPRRSLPSAITLYGSIIAAGIGAGMLVEVWVNKKIAEDGDVVIWELEK